MLVSCRQNVKKQYVKIDAQEIIDKSIAISGGDLLESSTINFDFRDKHYLATRNKGDFSLMRIFKRESDSVFDMLTNQGFERAINDTNIQLADSMKVKYSASVNSVHYFSVLPYGLNAKAVQKKYLESVEIKGKTYYKIKVTFNENGGGEDFEDVFVYWFDNKTNKVDYLAYSYNEGDGKGLRFRVAYNERFVNGIRFVDYNNYKPNNNTVSVLDLDDLFKENQLKLLSKIELKNVNVELINN